MSVNRLDVFLVENMGISGRENAKEMIKSGQVTVNGNVCIKPSKTVSDNDFVNITGETLKYVGRGGLKLEHAIKQFGLSVENCVCMDIGASTGGFTDCMLQNGADKVYAVDVGHDQLALKLINNPKVVNMEKMDIRNLQLADFSDNISFISVDVSFISLKLILEKVQEFLCADGKAVILVKPQFEAGKANVNKQGIVRKPKVHMQVLTDITTFAKDIGFTLEGLCFSPVKGLKGNIEYLLLLSKSEKSDIMIDVQDIVSSAFNTFKRGE